MRDLFAPRLLRAAAAALVLAAGPALAQEEAHRLAIHVDQDDPQVMNLALNNAQNVLSYYESQGEEVVIEIVAYGPGLNMYVADKSPVADRIAEMAAAGDSVTFAACENTLNAFEERAGTDIPLLSEATMVPSGVVRLMELQEEGYSYVRP